MTTVSSECLPTLQPLPTVGSSAARKVFGIIRCGEDILVVGSQGAATRRGTLELVNATASATDGAFEAILRVLPGVDVSFFSATTLSVGSTDSWVVTGRADGVTQKPGTPNITYMPLSEVIRRLDWFSPETEPAIARAASTSVSFDALVRRAQGTAGQLALAGTKHF